MKSQAHGAFSILFSLLIVISCSTVKLPPQEKTVQERSPREKTSPEKTASERTAQEKIAPEKIAKDTYTRTYDAEFTSFHARIHNALQDYARTHKGNAFQVARLGGDAVVIQGRYKREGDADRFFAVLTVKPAGKQKTTIQIKISSAATQAAGEYLEAAAADLFRIVENGSGVSAGQ